jgi:hypothetical protein
VSAAPERSPERAQLALAIERLSALDRQLERLAEARTRLDLRGLRRAPEALVAKAMGEPYDLTSTVSHAQNLLEDAQRDLDEATEADKLLTDEIGVVEGRRSIALHGRNDALAEVLRASPEVAALCVRTEQARQQLYDSTWIFSAIGVHRLPRETSRWDGILWGKNTGQGDAWKAALVLLESDPDAALPSD